MMRVLLQHFETNRRNSADSRTARISLLVWRRNRLVWGCDERGIYFQPLDLHHFRTPSPCGRCLVPSQSPPTYSFQPKPLIQQGFAQADDRKSLPLIPQTLMSGTEVGQRPEQRGSEQCRSRHGELHLPARWRLARAVTRLANRVSSVRAQALQPRWCWTDRLLQARLWGQQATCFTARPTRANVNDRPSRRFARLIGRRKQVSSLRTMLLCAGFSFCAQTGATRSTT